MGNPTLAPKGAPTFIGYIRYEEIVTGQIKEVKVKQAFWNSQEGRPTSHEMHRYLFDQGYMHAHRPEFFYVM